MFYLQHLHLRSYFSTTFIMLQDYSEGTHTPVKLVHNLLLHHLLKPAWNQVFGKVMSASSTCYINVYIDTLTTWYLSHNNHVFFGDWTNTLSYWTPHTLSEQLRHTHLCESMTVLIKSANTNLQTREQHPEEGKTLVVRVKVAWLASCFLPSANPFLKAKDLVDLLICSQQI